MAPMASLSPVASAQRVVTCYSCPRRAFSHMRRRFSLHCHLLSRLSRMKHIRHLVYQHQHHMPFDSFEPPTLEMFGSPPIGEQPATSSNAHHHIDSISQPFSSGSFIGLPEPEHASADDYADNATAVVDLESPGPDSSATGFEIHTDDGNPSDSFSNGHFD